jgi:hypothetical protein
MKDCHRFAIIAFALGFNDTVIFTKPPHELPDFDEDIWQCFISFVGLSNGPTFMHPNKKRGLDGNPALF